MGEITKLAKATSKSESLRTTIPSGIVKQLNLKEGDEIDWILKVDNGKLIVVVIPVKKK